MKFIRRFKNQNDMGHLTFTVLFIALGAIVQYMLFGHLLPSPLPLIMH